MSNRVPHETCQWRPILPRRSGIRCRRLGIGARHRGSLRSGCHANRHPLAMVFKPLLYAVAWIISALVNLFWQVLLLHFEIDTWREN